MKQRTKKLLLTQAQLVALNAPERFDWRRLTWPVIRLPPAVPRTLEAFVQSVEDLARQVDSMARAPVGNDSLTETQ
jgi:hypothetical protein